MTPKKAKPHRAGGPGATSWQRKITGNHCIARRHKGAIDADAVGAGTKLRFFAAESKVGDSRYRWFVDRYGERCWELDALSPVVLRQQVVSGSTRTRPKRGAKARSPTRARPSRGLAT